MLGACPRGFSHARPPGSQPDPPPRPLLLQDPDARGSLPSPGCGPTPRGSSAPLWPGCLVPCLSILCSSPEPRGPGPPAPPPKSPHCSSPGSHGHSFPSGWPGPNSALATAGHQTPCPLPRLSQQPLGPLALPSSPACGQIQPREAQERCPRDVKHPGGCSLGGTGRGGSLGALGGGLTGRGLTGRALSGTSREEQCSSSPWDAGGSGLEDAPSGQPRGCSFITPTQRSWAAVPGWPRPRHWPRPLCQQARRRLAEAGGVGLGE